MPPAARHTKKILKYNFGDNTGDSVIDRKEECYAFN